MAVIGNGFGLVIASGVNTNPSGDNTPVYFSDCATPVALPTCTYNNGTSGVGATLTANSNGALTTTYTDGVALSVGLIILVWKQSSALQNGLYEVTQIGTAGTPWILTRLGVYDTTSEVFPSQVNVLGGTTYANLYFLQQTANPTIGSSSIVFGTATAPTGTTINQNLRLVDTYTASALPTCTYTPNASATTPGLNAYLKATVNGAFPTLNGVAPFQYMKVLVSGQADQTQNGDYILQNVGSASSTWRLSRISYTSTGLYPIWWGIYQGTGRGLIFEQTTSTLTTATIGVSGNIVFVQVSSSGLTYFTEAQNTSAPNATVYVDSLTAVSSTTDADISIVPKGTGAFQLAVPDNTSTNGEKRGARAVDLQLYRTSSSSVASGASSFLVGSDSRATATGAIAIGVSNNATNSYSVCIGSSSTASGGGSVAIGSSCLSSGGYSFSSGLQSTASNSYAVAMGYLCTASGQSSVSLGQTNATTSTGSIALGVGNTATGYVTVAMGSANVTSADNQVAIGTTNTFTGASVRAMAFGNYNTLNSQQSMAFGNFGLINGIFARQVFSANRFTTNGDSQKSIFFLNLRTTDATTKYLTTDASGSQNALNIINLSNNSLYRYKGQIIAKQSGSVNVASWDVDGMIVRGASAGTTVLLVNNINLVQNTPAWTTPIVSAVIDAFNGVGGLSIQVNGNSATNIQWNCIIETTELIYA